MSSNLKMLISAVGAAALLSTSAMAQPRGSVYGLYRNPPIQGSVYGPLYNLHYQSNGTGTVPDWNRDPHNDR
jgi:hypothetical protein